MNKSLLLIPLIAGISSCKFGSSSDRLAAENAGARAFQLRLAPQQGGKYAYDISSRTEYNFEAEGKKFDNLSKIDAAVDYTIERDSVGDCLFHIRYRKLHIYSKNGNAESDLDAANAANSGDPVEQLLGYLKDATIVATLSPTGQVKKVDGFREMYEKFMGQFGAGNAYAVAAELETEWRDRDEYGEFFCADGYT